MGINELLNMKEPVDSREGKLTLLALLMMLYVIALFFSIAIHEVLGHGLFAVLLGGQFYAVYISPGSGFASLWLPQTMSQRDIGLVYMAGILVQLVLGSLTLFLVLPRVKNVILGLFTLMFCVGMLVHSSMYMVMGYYYEGGDTLYAVRVLGVQPDAFLVGGIILTGLFVLLISMAALKFMGRFMDLDEDPVRQRALALFWFPPALLSGAISLVYSLFLTQAELVYPFLNSALLLLFIGAALYLVPIFSEPMKTMDYGISMRSVFTVVLCFTILMAGWAGVFGLSRETARGVMVHQPPVEAEIYYSDYTVGNADIMIYANGTVMVEIILRNIMESPTPLENDIYRTFDRRPDWERHIARSRNMLMAMFDLPRNVGENLTFSTDYGTIKAKELEDDLGRKCTTYIDLADIGTRQFHLTPGDQSPQPGLETPQGDFALLFKDPWVNQGGYLDEVRVAWEGGLEAVDIIAWNAKVLDISYEQGNVPGNSVVWGNTDYETSPSAYWLAFKFA